MLNWLRTVSGRQAKPNSTVDGDVKQWMKDGFAAFQVGNQDAAAVLFNKILRERSNHADALYLSGVIASRQGRAVEACDLISRAVQSDPSVFSFHFDLANVMVGLGKLDEAVASYRRAAALDPNDAQSRFSLGCALHAAGKSDEAVGHLRDALRLAPDVADMHYNLGIVLQSLGRTEESAGCYREALSINPGNAEAGNNLGVLLHAQGRVDDAIACFRRALEGQPDHVQALSNLGAALLTARRVDEAESCLLRAIELNPRDFSAHRNIALALREQGKLEASAAASLRALEIQDSVSERIRMATLLPVVARSAQEIRTWRSHFAEQVGSLLARGGVLEDPLRDVGTPNFNLAYQPECNRELQEKAAQLYAAMCPALLYTAPHCRRPTCSANARIKVGFISKFMFNHSIGRTTRGLLANVDRDRFHITALFVPPLVDDAISGFIRDSADSFLVLPDTLEAARDKIAALELDILFYQDIGMDAYTYFLAFSRLAPVQCVSFGHPDTTGIPAIDYWVSSNNFEPEGAAAHYSEELFLLKGVGSLAYYYRPALAEPARSRDHFGLPSDRHLYLCPQTLFKLHPDFDAILANILRRDPLGEVVLIEARTSSWGTILRQRIRETAPDVAARVRFVPGMSPDDFLALIATCDVMLDTIYFNGMNTSLEALAVGTPVVTMPTALQRGRHTYGMYARMGMDDCVARTPEQYVDIAVKVGTDKDLRENLKAKILSRSRVLYEEIEVVREFERFFVEAHARAVES